MRFKGPLADSYLAAVALVVCALVPYLALSTALGPLGPVIDKSVGLSEQSFELTTGMANAAYAFGTVLAVQLALHLPQRRMLLIYATLFVLSSVLAAGAWTPGLFVAGHVVQGLTTSLMLIAAVPPLVLGWPVARTRWTAMTMNFCIFGAVALGPVIGGVQAAAKDFRPLFWIVAGVGALAVAIVLLTWEDQPAQDDSAPWDWVAQLLAGGGCAAAFFGASELTTHRFLSLICLLPLLAGSLLVAALLVHQFSVRRPLMPVRSLMHTLPLSGVLIAMCAGAASIAIVELVQTVLKTRFSPEHMAMLFWPEFGGAVLAALLFAGVFRSRFMPLLPFAGLAMIAAAAAVLSGVAGGSEALLAAGAGVLGLGVGASVSPALFVAGFSQESEQLQRIFAVVELLRGVAAFLTAPVLLHLAKTLEQSPASGFGVAIWVCFGIVAGGLLLTGYLFVLGRVRLRPPDLERWLGGEGTALDSPPLLAGVRGEGFLPPLGRRAGSPPRVGGAGGG